VHHEENFALPLLITAAITSEVTALSRACSPEAEHP